MSDSRAEERKKTIDWDALIAPDSTPDPLVVETVSNPKKSVDWNSMKDPFDENISLVSDTLSHQKRISWDLLIEQPDEKD